MVVPRAKVHSVECRARSEVLLPQEDPAAAKVKEEFAAGAAQAALRAVLQRASPTRVAPLRMFHWMRVVPLHL